jgi:vacuolar protein sorting-associated protein 54
MLRDAEYFKTKLGSLDGAGDTGDYIVNLVKGKPVPKPKAAPEPRPPEPKPPEMNGKSSVDTDTPPPEVKGEKVAEEKKESVEEKAAT